MPGFISPEEGLEWLRAGKVVALPTETVYGLAGDGYNLHAIAAIYALKGRPSTNPLILHYRNKEASDVDVEWTPWAEKVAHHFWPGPLTLVLSKRSTSRIPSSACAELTSVAIRVPSHPIFQTILSQYPNPLAAPSANPSGGLSPTTSQHVKRLLPTVPIVEGGTCIHGLESTILDGRFCIPRVLRPGAISVEQIEAVLGHAIDRAIPNSVEAPGMLTSHYKPSKPLRLNAQTILPQEGLLAFGPPCTYSPWTLQLSLATCLTEAAANLFSALHSLDLAPCKSIAVMPIPHIGLGQSINDRLTRAAWDL